MKKLLVILGIILLAGLATACKKQQKEPVSTVPEDRFEAVETPAADDETGDLTAMEDEGPSLEEEQEAAWDAEEEQQGEDYALPEWDITEPESQEEPPADADEIREEDGRDEMVQEEPEADMEEPQADSEQLY